MLNENTTHKNIQSLMAQYFKNAGFRVEECYEIQFIVDDPIKPDIVAEKEFPLGGWHLLFGDAKDPENEYIGCSDTEERITKYIFTLIEIVNNDENIKKATFVIGSSGSSEIYNNWKKWISRTVGLSIYGKRNIIYKGIKSKVIDSKNGIYIIWATVERKDPPEEGFYDKVLKSLNINMQ